MKICKKIRITEENIGFASIIRTKIDGIYYNNIGPSHLLFRERWLRAVYFINNDCYEPNKVSSIEFTTNTLAMNWWVGRTESARRSDNLIFNYDKQRFCKAFSPDYNVFDYDFSEIQKECKKLIPQILMGLSSTKTFMNFLIENKKFDLVDSDFSKWTNLLNENL